MSPFRASAPFTERWEHFSLRGRGRRRDASRFDRPDKLNALTFEAYADLRDLVAELPHRGDARVLGDHRRGARVLLGRRRRGDHRRAAEDGGRGAARVHAHDRRGGQGRCATARCRSSPRSTASPPAPGSVIALACDFRLLARVGDASPSCSRRSGSSGADMGSAYLLPRLVGLGRATELLMLGDKVDAERALAIGLATEVVDDELRGAAAALARRLADGPALAYAHDEGAALARAGHGPRRRDRDGGARPRRC